MLPLAILLMAFSEASISACSIRREPDHFKSLAFKRLIKAWGISDPTYVGCYGIRGVRSWPFFAFAGEFPGLEAELAAAGDFAGGVLRDFHTRL